MFNRLKFLCLPMLLLCSACATLDEDECLSADWASIGFEDGTQGRLSTDRLERHGKACAKHDVVPDEEQYLLGHADGVLDYCTPQQGRRLGRTGAEYNGVCPSSYARDFVGEYIAGLTDELDDLDFDEERAEENLSDAREERNLALIKNATDKTLKRKKKKIESAKSRLLDVKSRQRKVRRLIAEWSRELAVLP